MAGEALPSVTLVLGGARSGKSAYAEGLVTGAVERGVYVATAREGEDAEMRERIAAHRRRRSGFAWRVVEAPLDLSDAVGSLSGSECPVLVDCLSLWLANLMEAGRDPVAEGERLLAAARGCSAGVVFVSLEVGLGVVPVSFAGRAFRDRLGVLNCSFAAEANQVFFVMAGLPARIKPGSA